MPITLFVLWKARFLSVFTSVDFPYVNQPIGSNSMDLFSQHLHCDQRHLCYGKINQFCSGHPSENIYLLCVLNLKHCAISGVAVVHVVCTNQLLKDWKMIHVGNNNGIISVSTKFLFLLHTIDSCLFKWYLSLRSQQNKSVTPHDLEM